ncbi:hypothetical protein LAZ67_9000345 [Cordylochernes scorpioides]|uniref:Uncharacterized protein n=1 Tax=Cordylochernes scorpioides TaxID=51811 RepID=A0ABY6KUE9_9ARAC|nr:hypothetical protein LAZ67_9000345 [Cordylochernes scorpioides]
MTVLERSTPLRGGLQASCCLKRSDCCLPPTPVYFLEYSRRFYGLLSPVLLLLSLTVLQLIARRREMEYNILTGKISGRRIPGPIKGTHWLNSRRDGTIELKTEIAGFASCLGCNTYGRTFDRE